MTRETTAVRPLAVIGNLSRDFVDRAPPRIGGGPYYAARAFRALGRRASIATKCAREHRHDFLPRLVALGTPIAWRPSARTATFGFRYEGDRRVMTVEELGDPWTADEARGWVADAVRRSDWVHVAPLLRSDFPTETIAELARGRRLSLDGQGLARRPQTGPLVLDGDFDRDLLRFVTILKLAEEEAAALLGGEPTEDALRTLGVPEIVLTFGAGGSLVIDAEQAQRVPARPVRGRDPTGAGDAFAVAYLAARSAGHRPVSSARRATALVAQLLTERGR
jgi:sugar/nucleoside kinase (ribokinase family)